MWNNRHGRAIVVLLIALMIAPLATLAAHSRCLTELHACAPAPDLLTCCCVAVADDEQLSPSAGIVIVNGPAAGGAGTTRPIATVPSAAPTRPAPPLPVDRRVLFSPLLI
jgi:hypothetical protein